jgi:hypothetical protein
MLSTPNLQELADTAEIVLRGLVLKSSCLGNRGVKNVTAVAFVRAKNLPGV